MKTKTPSDPVKLQQLSARLSTLQQQAVDKPLHALLSGALELCIDQGDWVAGERLPTEAELIKLSGYSLGTVQRAFRSLIDNGRGVRRQGSGSFVQERLQPVSEVSHIRFLDDDGHSLLPIYSEVLRRTTLKTPGDWSAYFPDPQAQVIRIDRRITVHNEFDVLSRFYVDSRRFKQLASTPLQALNGLSFITMVQQQPGIRKGPMTKTLQCIQPSALECRLLQLPPGQFVNRMEVIQREQDSGLTLFRQEFFIPLSRRPLLLHPD
jgi:DNA-binding GntR family transcriptional regulator